MLYQDKTDRIIKAFFRVYNKLGYGFLERVYHNAFLIELSAAGFEVKSQFPIKVFYYDYKVGDYFADIIVDNCIVIENKAMESIREEHEYQLINYPKATDIEVGLLLISARNLNSEEKYSQIPIKRGRNSIRVNPPNPRHPCSEFFLNQRIRTSFVNRK